MYMPSKAITMRTMAGLGVQFDVVFYQKQGGRQGRGALRQRGRPELPQGTQTPLPLMPAGSKVQKGLPSSSAHGGCRRPPQGDCAWVCQNRAIVTNRSCGIVAGAIAHSKL